MSAESLGQLVPLVSVVQTCKWEVGDDLHGSWAVGTVTCWNLHCTLSHSQPCQAHCYVWPGRVKCRLQSSSRVLVNSQELDPGASRDVLAAYL